VVACAINAAAVATTPRHRPGRRRPLVSWPLYRLLLVVSLVFPVTAALAVREPAIPAPPEQVLTMSGTAVANAAGAFESVEQASGRACCGPGSPGELVGARWVASKLHRFDAHPLLDQFGADLAWTPSPVAMTNVIAYAAGRQPGVIAVIVHRDGSGADIASGTAMLVELGRLLAPLPLQRGIVLVSTDGGTSGGQGVARFASTWPLAKQIVAAIVLQSVGAPAGTRLSLLLRSQSPRGTSPTLVAAARQQIVQSTGIDPSLPGAYDQLSGYAIPYAPGEQGPLLAHGVPALGIAGGPLAGRPEQFSQLDVSELSGVGTAVANMVAELDVAPSIEPAGPPTLFLGGRVVRGWLVQVALTALLAPVLACVLDLVAGLRRRRLPLAPGVRALAWRTSAWLVALLVLWLLTLAPGRLVSPVESVPLPGRTGVTNVGLLLTVGLALVYWRFVTRPRLARIRPVSGGERTAGLATGLAGMVFASLLLAAVNPFALILVLPAAHAWLWLALAARAGRRAMGAVWLLGLLGPAMAVMELWSGQGLGSQAPRALVAMVGSGYLSPAVSVCLALFAAAGCQLASLVLGRYSPAHAWTMPPGRVARRRPPARRVLTRP
jgi:Peptidase family M28